MPTATRRTGSGPFLPAHVESAASPKPRWNPAYTVVAVSTLALMFTAPGQTFMVSLLNMPLRQAFGLDAFALNSAYTIATVSASLPLVWVGKLTDRLGPRRMMILVALAFGAGCVFTALIAHVVMVFVAFFLLRFLGQASLSMVSGHVLAMWFDRQLGRLTGIRAVVLFAAWAPLPALAQALIESFGWRAVWALFGVLIGITLPLVAWRFLHDRPEDVGLALDGAESADRPQSEPGHSLRDALRTKAYWLMVVPAAIPPMVGTATMFDIQPLFALHGLDATVAARAVGAWSLTMAICAIPAGYLVDRIRPGRLLAVGTLAIGAGSGGLIEADAKLMAFAAIVLLAIGQSLVMPTVAASAARFFGRRHHGAIRSSITRIGIIATGVGPLVFGLSQRFTDGYATALVGFAALCVPVAFAALWLSPPADSGSA